MKYIVLGVGVAVLVMGIVYFSFSQSPQQKQSDTRMTQARESARAESAQDQLVIEDVKTGEGAEAKVGNSVSVHYIGTLTDGTKFDSSYDRGKPFSFTLGKRSVILGWERGILGMKVNGKRKLIIPPSLAYKERGIPGAVPPNATLVFEVEMLEIR